MRTKNLELWCTSSIHGEHRVDESRIPLKCKTRCDGSRCGALKWLTQKEAKDLKKKIKQKNKKKKMRSRRKDNALQIAIAIDVLNLQSNGGKRKNFYKIKNGMLRRSGVRNTLKAFSKR